MRDVVATEHEHCVRVLAAVRVVGLRAAVVGEGVGQTCVVVSIREVDVTAANTNRRTTA